MARLDSESWKWQLLGSDFLITTGETVHSPVAGTRLFGINPNGRLPQAGITIVELSGIDVNNHMIYKERIRSSRTPWVFKYNDVVERYWSFGLWFFIRILWSDVWIYRGRCILQKAYSLEPVWEVVVNQLILWDYAFEGTECAVFLFSERSEFISPSQLQVGVMVVKMKQSVS